METLNFNDASDLAGYRSPADCLCDVLEDSFGDEIVHFWGRGDRFQDVVSENMLADYISHQLLENKEESSAAYCDFLDYVVEEYLWDDYRDWVHEEYLRIASAVESAMQAKLDDLFPGQDVHVEIDLDELETYADLIEDRIYFNYALDQLAAGFAVKFDLFLAEGDEAEHEFRNNWAMTYIDRAGVPAEHVTQNSAAAWLIEQFGDKREVLMGMGGVPQSRATEDLLREYKTLPPCSAMLTILLNAPIQDFIELVDGIAHGRGCVLGPGQYAEGPYAGFFDPWTGGGSDFMLVIPAGTEIPASLIHDIGLEPFGSDKRLRFLLGNMGNSPARSERSLSSTFGIGPDSFVGVYEGTASPQQGREREIGMAGR